MSKFNEIQNLLKQADELVEAYPDEKDGIPLKSDKAMVKANLKQAVINLTRLDKLGA